MDSHYVLQLLSTDHVPRQPTYMSGGAAPSPLFSIPKELRLLIYEFAFSSFPPAEYQSPPPKSSSNLQPLLTCREIYKEAKLFAFKCTTHQLNWSRASTCLRRLLILEPDQRANIRHVAINTSAAALYDKLQPLRYHLDRMRTPPLSLDSLTIILEPPEHYNTSRVHRIQELDMVFASVWYFKNVDKVVLVNVLHRSFLREYPGGPGVWTCMNNNQTIETTGMESLRWQVELTNFHDYTWKQWYGGFPVVGRREEYHIFKD